MLGFRRRSPTRTDTLHAVYDDDLEQLLERLEVLHDFRAGKARCKFSDDVITVENLEALFPEAGAVKFVCNRPECVIALVSQRSQ